MRNITVVLMALSIGFASCQKERKPMTKQEMQYKIDSATTARVKILDEEARIDLERRIKIEVKAKVDSILNARTNKQIKDSVPGKVILQQTGGI